MEFDPNYGETTVKLPAAGSLLSVLAAIPDERGRKGRRHSLAAMQAAIICGLLTGAKGCTAIAQWLHDRHPEFWRSISFTRRPPISNCFRVALLGLPPETRENAVRAWVTQ
ncbi:transposase family protein [Rosistilla carotiformis]|uniref:transposase family protein n=1 Tax=Rosistilla carotiformis TaxID=2528017 RepID=UPI0011A1F37D